MVIPTQQNIFHLEHTDVACDTHTATTHITYNLLPVGCDDATFPAHPLPMVPPHVVVEEVEDKYLSWHNAQAWLPASGEAILQPATEFFEGEGCDNIPQLNTMSTSSSPTQETSASVAEMDTTTTGTKIIEDQPNRNI